MFLVRENHSVVSVSATPWTIQSMEFPRSEYWSWQPFFYPGDLPSPGIEPRSSALQVDSVPAEPQGKSTYFKLLENWRNFLLLNSATQFIMIVLVIVYAFRGISKQDCVLYHLSMISTGKYITTRQCATLKQTALCKSEK